MKIFIDNDQNTLDLDLARAENSLCEILNMLGEQDREISLVFVDDEGIREINRQYLGRDYPTNVIAFSMNEGEFGDINPLLLGDIVISTETALRDGQAGGLTFEDELDYLMIHAVLHLLGYEHEEPEETDKMRKKENEVFFALKKYDLE